MDRFANWLWRRYRHHHLGVIAALLTAFVSTSVAAAALYAACLMEHVSGADTWRLLGVNVLAQGFTGLLLFAASARRLRPMRVWASGESDDVVAAWNTTLEFPTVLAVRMGWFMFLVDHIIVMSYANHLIHFTAAEIVAINLLVVPLEFAAMLIGALSARLLSIPIALELSPLLPEVAPARRELSTRWRLAAAVFLAAYATAFGTGGMATMIMNHDRKYAYVGLMALAITTYITVLVYVAAIKPTITPLRDLRIATERVSTGDFTERLPVVSADEFGDIAIAFNNMQQGLLERASLQAAFGSYVDPALAERVLSQGDSTFAGEQVEVSVFFADVRGFTTYSAHHEAEDAVALLNRLFALVVPIIREHGGHANTYSGDSVLAVFGTPQPLDAHADHAVAAAVDIQRAVCDEFSDELRVGIGVNTGKVIAGTIGGGGKLEFTVIGDTVNVASRVEGLTKDTGDAILLTQATVDALSAPPSGLCDRGLLEVRGKDEKLHVHGLSL